MVDKADTVTTTTGSTAGDSANDKEASASKVKFVIKSVDMPEAMQAFVFETVLASQESYNLEKDIAAHVKKELDKKYEPTWHAVVGKNFGSFVTHESKNFIYFYVGPLAFLLWKT